MDWHYEEGGSDVKRVAGDYPALFGWELGGLERGDTHNLDSVPFDKMRDLAVKADQMGGINTFSWHPYEVIEGRSSWTRDVEVVKHILPGASYHEAFKSQLDKVAHFLKSIKREDGKSIPFIFRPWHEMDGTWFWWGSKQCTPEEFKKLFVFTVKYLREDKGIDNMLVAYSPDRNFESSEEYLTWYPGDVYVDILGVDNYHDLKQERRGTRMPSEKLHIVIAESKTRNKLSAFTETGLENVKDTDLVSRYAWELSLMTPWFKMKSAMSWFGEMTRRFISSFLTRDILREAGAKTLLERGSGYFCCQITIRQRRKQNNG